jgi:DNA helicase HerA-like ATPase
MHAMNAHTLLLGQGSAPAQLLLRYANRHGLVAGATGTGKTVTLQSLAEGFSSHGVPVFLADVKGDLSGIGQVGTASAKLLERAQLVGLDDYAPRAFPVTFWDVFGNHGHPLRTTISDMGPLLLARLLELSEAQEGALNIVFKVADEEGLLLLDLKDLRALLSHVGENSGDYTQRYGNVTKPTIGAIQRRLLVLENQGAENFFGEPALQLTDLMRSAADGRGMINILAADKLIESPRLYATSLLWLLAELFEELPEVGDADKPRLVFFFDEAHLLFDDAPKALVSKIEQVVRLIRSKGVGVYFVTQNPMDIPDTVLGQLGNRVQHALRAFTPKDQKALRAAAETFRANPQFNTAEVLGELGVGYALVSTLGEGGVPTVVDKVAIRPPQSRLGPVTEQERQALIQASPLHHRYAQLIDRHSAYEQLAQQVAARQQEPVAAAPRERQSSAPRGGARSRETPLEAFVKSAARAVGGQLGRQILRGVLGSLTRRR